MHWKRYLWLLGILGILTVIAYMFSGPIKVSVPSQSNSLPQRNVPSGFPRNAPSVRPQDAASEQHGFDMLVAYTDTGFEPASAQMTKGQTIRFINNGSRSLTLRSSAQLSLPSKPLFPRDYAEVTFDTPGVFIITDGVTGTASTITVR